MAPQHNSTPRLAAYETLLPGSCGVEYIQYRSEVFSKPGTFFTQIDVLPVFTPNAPSSPPAAKTEYLVSPRQPIPLRIPAADRNERWTLDDPTAIWHRGSTTWGPAKLVMRVYDKESGEYIKQIRYGKTSGKFEVAATSFDLNDANTVRNYNLWVSKTLCKYIPAFKEAKQTARRAWTKAEIVLLRTYVNAFIAEEGLIKLASGALDWDEDVPVFNKMRRRMGLTGPDRSVNSVKRLFRTDEGIQMAVRGAKRLRDRMVCGDNVADNELKPKEMIALKGVERRRQGPKRGKGVRLRPT